MAQLIDAIHILCRENITPNRLQEADQLLNRFVDQFEILYGEERMVFNVHLLKYLATCVRQIGPLNMFSTYNFEDYLGHLVSLQKGTTDVATQICEKYTLEKNMYYHLARSDLAQKFFDDINGRRKHKHFRRISGSLLLGKSKQKLCQQDVDLISNALQVSNNFHYEEYDSILLNSKIFYETTSQLSRKSDSFIFDSENKKFAIIESIFVINDYLYFLVNEKFEILNGSACKSNIPLRKIDSGRKVILRPEFIGPKFALIEFDNNIYCSKFPNMSERD